MSCARSASSHLLSLPRNSRLKLPELNSQASASGSMSSAVQVSVNTRSLIHNSSSCRQPIFLTGPRRVENWRGVLGGAYPLPALSFSGASLAQPCSVSSSRSSNRTGGFPASGSRTRLVEVVNLLHAFAHGKLRGKREAGTSPASHTGIRWESVSIPRPALCACCTTTGGAGSSRNN